jgi:predicted nucleotidyltransferase
MPDIQRFLAELAKWAADRDDIVAVALVGSYARGAARPDSDVDVVIMTDDPRRYLDDTRWVEHFGETSPPQREDYGMVQSLRVTYGGGLEVEFGLTVPQWAGQEGLVAGTRGVVSDGCRIVFDRHGVLAALLQAVAGLA